MSETPNDLDMDPASWTPPWLPQRYLTLLKHAECALILSGAEIQTELDVPLEQLRAGMMAMREALERAPSQRGVPVPVPIYLDGVRIGMQWQFFPMPDLNGPATAPAPPLVPLGPDDSSDSSLSSGMGFRDAIADYLVSRWDATAGMRFLAVWTDK